MYKFLYVLVISAGLFSAAAGYFCWQMYWVEPERGAAPVMIEFKAGESAGELANRLEAAKIIGSARIFKWYLQRKKWDTKIAAGYFTFFPGENISSVADALINPSASSVKLLFKEGQTVRDYGHNVLEYNGIAQAEELQELTGFQAVDYRWNKDMPIPKDFSGDFDFLKDKPKYLGLEGYLFPDTYFVNKTDGVEKLARLMLQNFGKKLTPEIRSEISRQDKTIHEVATMASLIEAEAREDADRRLISDILWRRLSIGMALQLDSTVNYVTGESKPAVSAEEMLVDSPYNTYKYRGLPPGPINNPGLEALRAAVYPEKNDYWFFLSGKDGKMYYAKTLDEHNKNKYKYLK